MDTPIMSHNNTFILYKFIIQRMSSIKDEYAC